MRALLFQALLWSALGSVFGGCIFDPSGAQTAFDGHVDHTEAGTNPDAGPLDGELPDAGATCQNGQLRCENGILERCDGGQWQTEQDCLMGCSPQETRCAKLNPSNAEPDLMEAGNADLQFNREIVFDTDTGQVHEPAGTEIRPAGTGVINDIRYLRDDANCNGLGVFALRSLDVGSAGTLRAQGTRGLVLLVNGPVTIHGRITASAHHLEPGAGGYPGGPRGQPGQGAGGGQPGNYYENISDSGAGGGGHVAAGGRGGDAGEAEAGGGGAECGAENLVPLCGGSGGGGQWGPDFADRGSEGGAGGGAVQISASGEISVPSGGVIDVCGGGGSGGHPGGGGGGGAGGAILLEGPEVRIDGELLSNGGGGGSGGYEPDGAPGQDGIEGGAGGPAPTLGGAGGAGGAQAMPQGGAGIDHANNGGGGGGAAGIIRLNTARGTAVINGNISPALYSEGTVAVW
jgi:hypothetical protein